MLLTCYNITNGCWTAPTCWTVPLSHWFHSDFRMVAAHVVGLVTGITKQHSFCISSSGAHRACFALYTLPWIGQCFFRQRLWVPATQKFLRFLCVNFTKISKCILLQFTHFMQLGWAFAWQSAQKSICSKIPSLLWSASCKQKSQTGTANLYTSTSYYPTNTPQKNNPSCNQKANVKIYQLHLSQFFLRNMLGSWYELVGTRFLWL